MTNSKTSLVAIAICRAFAPYAKNIEEELEKTLGSRENLKDFDNDLEVFACMKRVQSVASTPIANINDDTTHRTAVKAVFFLNKHFTSIVNQFHLDGEDINLIGVSASLMVDCLD